MIYDIRMGSDTVGEAAVEQQGLYYRIHCSCHLPEGEFYRVTVQGSHGSVNLGTCVPEQGIFRIHTRVPVKYLGTDALSFQIEENNERFIPIRENEPFLYLSQLPDCKLTYEDGKPGIRISPA